MYYYPEYLRSKGALRVVAIVLGVCLAIAIALRLWLMTAHTPAGFANSLQSSPTAHVTTRTLADGTRETTVDNPAEHVHAVIDRRGNLMRMDATLPSSRAVRHNDFSMGTSFNSETHNGITRVTFTSEPPSANIGVGILFGISALVGLVAATMLGGSLAKENAAHLELAWTKPVSRSRLALAYIGIDVAAIVLAQIFAVAVMMVEILMFIRPTFYVNGATATIVAFAFAGPIAWNACLTAFSASLKRGLGMVIGLGWLVAIVIPGIAKATANTGTSLWDGVHAIFQAVSYIDPFSYISLSGSHDGGAIQLSTVIGMRVPSALIALLALALTYYALAVLQWRRVEA